MKEKVNFPGYDKQQEEKRKNAIARAQKRADRKAEREEKRKNKIPAFLVIRGGALNMLIVGLIGAAGLATLLAKKDYVGENLWLFLMSVSVCLTSIGLEVAPYSSEKQLHKIRNNIKDLNDQADEYVGLHGTWDIAASKMHLMVLPYVVKQKPGIFDIFIKYPKSISDMKIAESILLTHLKSHPDDAQKVLDTFNAESLPKKLYRRANRYAKRLNKSEKTR